MKLGWITSALMLAAASATNAHGSEPSGSAGTALCTQRADDVLAALKTHRFGDATARFDARMAAALDAKSLGQVWTDTLPAQVGALRSSDAAHASAAQGHPVIETRLHFEKADLVMRVACDAAGAIGGLRFVPAPPAAAAAAAPHVEGVHEQSLEVLSPLGPLPGTLTLPESAGPFPAVLLVAGSGPQDRDETIGPNKPLRDIAMALARAGIASLRYDKRTRVYAGAMAGRPLGVDDEVTDDAVHALATLAATPRIDPHRLFVAGHSLGALMAPRIAARYGKLAGIILLSAPTRLDLDVVLHQLHYLQSLPGAKPAGSDEAIGIDQEIHRVEAARAALAKADPDHPPAGEFFHAPASYWLSLHAYDPIVTAGTLTAPMLILQGTDDFQVPPMGNFSSWEKAFGNTSRVTLRAYPGLSHLFMPAGDPPSPADYEHPGKVDPRVLHDMAQWVLKQSPAAG